MKYHHIILGPPKTPWSAMDCWGYLSQAQHPSYKRETFERVIAQFFECECACGYVADTRRGDMCVLCRRKAK